MTAVAEQPTKKAKKKADEPEVVTASEPSAAPQPGERGFDWQAEYPGEKVFIYTREGITVGFAAISKKRQPKVGFLEDAQALPEYEQVQKMAKFVSSPAAWDIVREEWTPADLIEMWDEWSAWNLANAGK